MDDRGPAPSETPDQVAVQRPMQSPNPAGGPDQSASTAGAVCIPPAWPEQYLVTLHWVHLFVI